MPKTGKYGLIRLPVYTPANGSEGEWFEGWWCANCTQYLPYDDGCRITFLKRLTDPSDDGHPDEWVTLPGGITFCTGFEARSPEALEEVQARVWAVANHQRTLHEQEQAKKWGQEIRRIKEEQGGPRP